MPRHDQQPTRTATGGPDERAILPAVSPALPRFGRALRGVLVLAAGALLLTACSDDEDSSPGDADLFCDSAREAFTGGTEFDFSDPAQRTQVLDVFERMAEYAPGEIKDEAEATHEAMVDYVEAIQQYEERQQEATSGEGGEITTEEIEEIQSLVEEIQNSDALQGAREEIEPYLQETCAVDLDTTPSTTATTGPPAEEAPAP